ncbi:hypothetical protein [Chromobacterium violaceum]|uniref:hypothetical protein n=1 Tax=Chromobacterium violaceum TaxID=536 RepID=UPI001B334BBB|nr:hypothetical protein [Chromobacterium violaceum]MBP4047332.1 hypothetical protein [Chromobacterium violaceum]
MDQGLVVSIPVGRSVAFRSELGHAAILPNCDGGGFVQQGHEHVKNKKTYGETMKNIERNKNFKNIKLIIDEYILKGVLSNNEFEGSTHKTDDKLTLLGYEVESSYGNELFSKTIFIRNESRAIESQLKIYAKEGKILSNGLQFQTGQRLQHVLKYIKKLAPNSVQVIFDDEYMSGAVIINDEIVMQFRVNNEKKPKNYMVRTIESDKSLDPEINKEKIATKTARIIYVTDKISTNKKSTLAMKKIKSFI